jgi:hypothetical protein
MAHNGVIRKHIPGANSILNDTQTFIKNFVHNMYSSNNEFLTVGANIKALEEEAGSKLCFLDKDNMYIIGKFIEETNGILYSNDTYLSYDYGWDFGDYSVDFDYFDMFDVEGEPLDVKDFTDILSKLEFVKEDIVRFKVIEKNRCEKVLLKKDVSPQEESTSVLIVLESSETRLGGIINKPVEYWYEIELNPDTPRAQTIIGYDKLGPKIFRLYPEGSDENAE